MNIAFSFIIIISSVILLFTSPESVLGSMLTGATSSIEFGIKLLAIYSVWLGVLKILEVSNVSKYISKLFLPLTKRLFPQESAHNYNNINLNFAFNFLGVGGCATPLGIKACENMTSQKNKIMLVVINSSSIQLIPSTILGLRASYDARADILLASIICTYVTTLISIILVKVFCK